MKDSYKTIKVASEETLFKEKGSKFFGYAFPVSNGDEIKSMLAHLRKRHPPKTTTQIFYVKAMISMD